MRWKPSSDSTGFNPRPASSARRTGLSSRVPSTIGGFNPRPASSARRTRGLTIVHLPYRVSTHAPLRQRGEPCRSSSLAASNAGFQPTPRFVSEANANPHTAWEADQGFNPRPASSARRTHRGVENHFSQLVSTHAPLRQRGEPHDFWVAHRLGIVSTHAPLRQRGELA